MPRRTSTPAPGARSPGWRRSPDPWRKVGGIRPRTPRRRLPQRSRLLPASKGPTRSIFGLSCPRPPSSPRQTAGATGCRAGWASGARSPCWSAPPSAAGSSVRRPSSPSACRRRCRCSACGCWAGCSRCAAPSPTRSSRRCFRARAACTGTSARGWGDLSFVGGEVRDPERNLPRALVMGTAAIIAIYLFVNAAYLYLLPLGQMARSPLVAADAAQAVLGRIGVGAVTVVVMVATFSTLVGSILTAPRIFFAMADDGLFFRAIARVHPRYQTPSAAIVLTGFLGIGFVLIRTFEQLADQFVVAIFPFYALAAAAVFVLRRRRPDLPRPVRVLGYPVVPSLFVLASFLILGNALWAHPRETGFAFLIILLGVPVYSWWTRRRRSGVTQM